MRLIGIGLLAFLLAGLALLLTRSETLGQSARIAGDLLGGPELRFEPPEATSAGKRGHAATIRRAGPNTPLILTGLPSYQGATFHMPVDAAALSGHLQIDASTQVLDGAQAVLRVSIDNTRRAEVLLRPGVAARSFRIDLTPEDLARPRIVVSFSLQGTGPDATCHDEGAVAAVAEIETTSALHLTLDAPLSTPRDRIAAWGDRLHLAWGKGDAESLRLAAEAAHLGADVHFAAEGGLSALEAAQAIAERRRTRENLPIPGQAWSPAFAEASDLWGMRRFRHAQTWRIDYDLRQPAAGQLPATLLLSMRLGRQADGALWQVRVTHNGRLLADVVSDGAMPTLNERIPLPRTGGPLHRLEITASSTASQEGRCREQPALVAEILPATRILPSPETYADPITSLRDALVGSPGIAFALAPGVTSSEARVAATMIAMLLGGDPVPAPSAGGASVAVLSRGTLIDDRLAGSAQLVYRDGEGQLASDPATAWTGREADRVMLLVTPGDGAS
jgi:hypothetical protein